MKKNKKIKLEVPYSNWNEFVEDFSVLLGKLSKQTRDEIFRNNAKNSPWIKLLKNGKFKVGINNQRNKK